MAIFEITSNLKTLIRQMLKKYYFLKLLPLIYIFVLTNTTYAQEKRSLTLEDLFETNIFRVNSVYGINWMSNGQHYTSLQPSLSGKAYAVVKYDIKSGEAVDTLVDGSKIPSLKNPLVFTEYSLSADENKILLATDVEAIYRRSTKANFFVFNRENKTINELHNQKVSYATFSPDGSKVAYVRDNNLYYKSLSENREVAVTTDGRFNEIIYGSTDWVYEEEFSFAQAFQWSPDSKKIAFYRFNETDVKEYNMQIWGELYPQDYKFKYPKAGEKNSVVSILVHHLPENKTVSMETGEETDIYIPRIYWTHNPDLLSITRMNRLQNKLEILHGNVATGNTEVILTETSDTFVDIVYNDKLIYLPKNKGFIRTSEQSGYKHVYLHKMNGELIRQITEGNFEVDELVGYDEKSELIYFISTEDSPLERQFYRIGIKGKNKEKLSKRRGIVDVNMNPDFSYYIQYHSSATEPLMVTLHKTPDGELVRILEDNQKLRQKLETVNLNTKEFFTIPTEDTIQLNAYMIKPADFDPTQEYPVLMYVYGGPGNQTVLNNFSSQREQWHSFMADQGYIIVSVDNRGTDARGRDFKHSTYGQMGKLEVQDLINSAKFLANQPYIDKSRIGIWGWSYGGYMASLAMFIGNDIFKAGIAVAPVTNWRFYDTIYTERYQKLPQENPTGYDAYSPLTHADKLKGAFLLIHGTGDDNVHLQNSVELQNALIDAGKQFEMFYYPNRNHSIYGGNTRMHLFTMMTEFIMENL